ncbi:TetR-like C-terminal domain-containing protein [Salinicoccus luteus]|uniref:TetR-like C-terminal domain-containing protein n=1 Tax=Salinicoccus luteus TaxID=367840 RepID=UPI00146FC164
MKVILHSMTTKLTNTNELNIKDNKISSELIASYISYAIVGLILEWCQNEYEYSPKEMNRQLLELMRVSPYKTFNTKARDLYR